MPGIVPKYKEGPITYEVSTATLGGQLMTADTANPGKVRPAGASDTFILGVARTDARPALDADQVYTTPSGYPAHDASVPGSKTAVDWFGCFELVVDGAVAFGESVQPAASGQVAKAAGGTVIGVCVNPQGAASGQRALIRLQLLGHFTAPAAGA